MNLVGKTQLQYDGDKVVGGGPMEGRKPCPSVDL